MHIFICDDDRIFANKFAELVKEELHKHQIDTDIHTFLSESFLVYPQTFLRIRASGGYYCFACRYAHSFAGNHYFKLCAFHLHPSPTQHLLRGMPEQNPAHSLRKSGTEYFHSLYAFFLGKGAFALWFS